MEPVVITSSMRTIFFPSTDFRPFRAHTEGFRHVFQARLLVQPHLRLRPPGALQSHHVGRNASGPAYPFGKQRGLVEAPLQQTQPVQRHWHQQVRIVQKLPPRLARESHAARQST